MRVQFFLFCEMRLSAQVVALSNFLKNATKAEPPSSSFQGDTSPYHNMALQVLEGCTTRPKV